MGLEEHGPPREPCEGRSSFAAVPKKRKAVSSQGVDRNQQHAPRSQIADRVVRIVTALFKAPSSEQRRHGKPAKAGTGSAAQSIRNPFVVALQILPREAAIPSE